METKADYQNQMNTMNDALAAIEAAYRRDRDAVEKQMMALCEKHMAEAGIAVGDHVTIRRAYMPQHHGEAVRIIGFALGRAWGSKRTTDRAFDVRVHPLTDKGQLHKGRREYNCPLSWVQKWDREPNLDDSKR